MGTLYLVATPIGNLEDLSPRAVRILREADTVLAEDTRVSQKLLQHAGIARPMRPFHEHNERRLVDQIVADLQNGKSVAVISDAGTPGVADPAFPLVRAAAAAGITVTAVPGPCAAIAALVCSGLPTDRFVFENFLPPKSARRRRVLEELRAEHRTVIVYESPYRVLSTLEDMAEVLGDITVVAARELSKLHEEIRRGSAAELLAHFKAHPPRGEFVFLFNPRVRQGGATHQPDARDDDLEQDPADSRVA